MLNPSLFIADAPVVRTVKLADGTEHEMHFRELHAAEFEVFGEERRSKRADVRKTAVARLIAKCLCQADGTPVVTAEEADRLKAGVKNAIVGAVLEVNGLEAPGKPDSPDDTDADGSGTS